MSSREIERKMGNATHRNAVPIFWKHILVDCPFDASLRLGINNALEKK